MKRYIPDELKTALDAHQKWMRNEEDGSRADLSGADLSGAALSGAYLSGADLSGAALSGAYLSWADLSGAALSGAYLSWANLSWANLSWANLSGAYLSGAYLSGAGKNMAMAVFSGLYRYQCWAVVAEDGMPWVRMGCLWKPLTEWDATGIRQSNTREFPDDGSEASEQRVRAFDFTRAEALRLAAKFKPVEPAPTIEEHQ